MENNRDIYWFCYNFLLSQGRTPEYARSLLKDSFVYPRPLFNWKKYES